VHADPYLRSLRLSAMAVNDAAVQWAPPLIAPISNAKPEPPTLASVTSIPVGTPLAELCPAPVMARPTRERNRIALARLLSDLGWSPKPEVALTVTTDASRRLLWIAGAAPALREARCECAGCDHDAPSPAERLLAAGTRLTAEPVPGSAPSEAAVVDVKGRLRLTEWQLATIRVEASDELAAVGLRELGLLAITSATHLVLHGIGDIRVPPPRRPARAH
jgi:hypothetical protein